MRKEKSTKHALGRIRAQMSRLSRDGVFSQKEIILFGCTMWTGALLECLQRDRLKADAIVDNNPQKANGKCQGIDVYLPEDYLKNKEKGSFLVLICSGYWQEMAGQLTDLGLVQNTDFFIIRFYDKPDLPAKSMWNIARGYWIYQQLMMKLHGSNRWLFVFPYGGSGDIYMACIFLKQFLKREKIDDYLLLADERLALKTLRLFFPRGGRLITQEAKKQILDAWAFCGSGIMHVKPLLYWGWRTKRYPNPDSSMDITFLDVMKYDVYGYGREMPWQIPKRRADGGSYARDLFETRHFKKGKTVILAPYAGSYHSGISLKLWEAIAKRLADRGYCVCTNSAGDSEPVVAGTQQIFFPLQYAVDVVDYAGGFIGVRSGFCDILSASSAVFVVLYERALNAVKYEYFSFVRMGLKKDAREFVYSGENEDFLIEQIVSEFETEKLVLFGAGREAEKYVGCLRTIGVEPACFVDNNPGKWGTFLCGYQVLSPDMIKDMDCKVMISCNYGKELKQQLEEMGLLSRLVSYEPLFRWTIEQYILREAPVSCAAVNRTPCILIDAFDGIGWGGMEMWSYHTGGELFRRGYSVVIYGSDWQERRDAGTEAHILRFPLVRGDFWQTTERILKDMEQRLPFTLINNWTEHVFAAAYILKKKYPEAVKIISFVHNDCAALYEKQSVWQDASDKIAGVSLKITQKLHTVCKIPESKLCYRENFVAEFCEEEPAGRKAGEPIRIGWGARLEVLQKRADRLPELVTALEAAGIPYEMEIAGDGPCLGMLQDFILSAGRQDRVHLLGCLKPEDMQAFWNRQHIYINISEYEGSSLAMLEAMSCGAVPVVTDVSGTDEFVHPSLTGYRFAAGDYHTAAEKIRILYDDEDLRMQMAKNGSKLIREKCSLQDYVSYIERMI